VEVVCSLKDGELCSGLELFAGCSLLQASHTGVEWELASKTSSTEWSLSDQLGTGSLHASRYHGDYHWIYTV